MIRDTYKLTGNGQLKAGGNASLAVEYEIRGYRDNARNVVGAEGWIDPGSADRFALATASGLVLTLSDGRAIDVITDGDDLSRPGRVRIRVNTPI